MVTEGELLFYTQGLLPSLLLQGRPIHISIQYLQSMQATRQCSSDLLVDSKSELCIWKVKCSLDQTCTGQITQCCFIHGLRISCLLKQFPKPALTGLSKRNWITLGLHMEEQAVQMHTCTKSTQMRPYQGVGAGVHTSSFIKNLPKQSCHHHRGWIIPRSQTQQKK